MLPCLVSGVPGLVCSSAALQPAARNRVRTLSSCFYEDYDLVEEEEAMARYTALGIFDDMTAAEEEDDDDDTTTEQMVVRLSV